MSEKFDSLMHANLFEVFGERQADRRRVAIERIYTEDVVFSDPDESVTGRAAIDRKAQSILDGAPGFVFSAEGPVYAVQDLGYLAWGFGPVGQPPVVRGVDLCLIAGDRIARIYTLIQR